MVRNAAIFLLLIGSSLWISCGKVETAEALPPDLAFEMMRLRDPVTGKVPSELRYRLLPSRIIGQHRYKNGRHYPNSWQPIDDRFASLAITQVVYDPRDPDVFYFSTGEGFFNADAARGAGIWKSTDGGQSWAQLPATVSDTFHYCQDMLVHPASGDIYVSTRMRGVMRSQDGGLSWESVLHAGNGSQQNRAVDLEITGDGELLVSMGHFSSDGIYFSASGDPGTWERRMNGIPNATYRIELTASPSHPSILYAAAEGTSRVVQGIYRSDNKGMDWQQLPDPGGDDSLAKLQAWYDLIIKVDPNDPDVVVAGGLNIWRSRDGGQQWQQLTEGDRRKRSDLQYVHVDQHEVVFQNSDTVYFTNDGGIYRCTDFTADTPHIYQINQNYNVTQFYSVAQSAQAGSQLLVGGTQDNGSSHSTEQGVSDFVQVSWADGSFAAVDHEEESYLYTTTQFKRLFRYHHGELDTLTNPYIAKLSTMFINPIVMDANDPQTLFQASSQGVWRLSKARTAVAADWTQATRQVGGITALASSRSMPNLLIIGRSVDGIPYRIPNADVSDANSLPERMDRDGQLPDQAFLNCIFIDPADASHVLLAYSNYNVNSVWETRNALDQDPDWRSVEGDLPNIPVRWVSLHPKDSTVCYLATEMGVYYTERLNGALTKWKQADPGLPNVRIDMIHFRSSDQRMVVATHGRGMFEGTLDGNQIRWIERGPRNVGGRTRTLMIDPNEGDGQTLWAGSVSGGLWRIGNVDSVEVFNVIDPDPQNTDPKLTPNPAQAQVNVYSGWENAYPYQRRVYAVSGALVQQDETIRSAEEEYIDVSALANGLYLIVLEKDGEERVLKLVVQH